LLIPLRWIAILHDRVKSRCGHGRHSRRAGMLKHCSPGRRRLIASTLYENGSGQVCKILDGMRTWMEEKNTSRFQQLRGALSRENCPILPPSARQLHEGPDFLHRQVSSDRDVGEFPTCRRPAKDPAQTTMHDQRQGGSAETVRLRLARHRCSAL